MRYDGVEGLGIRLDAGVLRVHLDKPAKRNALDDEMVAALIGALEQVGHDDAVRVIALTGEGEHFCSGFDIVGRNSRRNSGRDSGGSQGGDRPRAGSIQRRLPTQAHRLIPLALTVQIPIVCAVQGWVAGIGLHLALAADVTVVTTDARVWEPFVERGLTPDSGGTWLLPRRIGEVRARQMLLLGRQLSGEEAVAWGLFHAAVPPGELEEETERIVRTFAEGPTVVLGLTKWLLHAGASAPIESHLRDEAFAMELAARSEDFREGLTAFREKRRPRFEGR